MEENIPSDEELNNKFKRVSGKMLDAFYSNDTEILEVMGGPHMRSQFFKTIGHYITTQNKIDAVQNLNNTDTMSFDLGMIKYQPTQKDIDSVVNKLENGNS